jgi:hypothetical protein
MKLEVHSELPSRHLVDDQLEHFRECAGQVATTLDIKSEVCSIN